MDAARGRRARDVYKRQAEDAAELLALPVESTRIECPWFADGRMGERLARFPRLETFVLAKGAEAGLDAAGLQQLAAIKTLRSLDLRAAELSGLELGPLADLPALTSLALRGLHKTPVLTALAPRIAELTLEQCDLLGDFYWLRICTRLRTLRLVDSFPPSSATELLAPPNLVNLTVRTKDRRHGAARSRPCRWASCNRCASSTCRSPAANSRASPRCLRCANSRC